jgi:hypothetical protein
VQAYRAGLAIREPTAAMSGSATCRCRTTRWATQLAAQGKLDAALQALVAVAPSDPPWKGALAWFESQIGRLQ